MSRTNYVPLKIVCGADVFAGTPFLSFTEYLLLHLPLPSALRAKAALPKARRGKFCPNNKGGWSSATTRPGNGPWT